MLNKNKLKKQIKALDDTIEMWKESYAKSTKTSITCALCENASRNIKDVPSPEICRSCVHLSEFGSGIPCNKQKSYWNATWALSSYCDIIHPVENGRLALKKANKGSITRAEQKRLIFYRIHVLEQIKQKIIKKLEDG